MDNEKGRSFTLTFRLNKHTPGALQFREVAAEGQPERVGTLYLKKWVVPQPYPDQITATVFIPVGVDATGKAA